MSNTFRLRRPATVLAMAVIASMGASVPAMGASPKRPAPVVVKKAVKATHVTLKGVVVAQDAKSLDVLTSSVKVSGPRKVASGRVVTISTSRLRRLHATVGQAVQATGTATLNGATLALTDPTSLRTTAAPTRAWVGRILAVDATTGALTVTRREHLDGTGERRDDDHPRRGYGHADGAMVVHTSAAAVSLDGVPTQASALAAGQAVVIMGSNNADVAAASNIFAFTTTPSITRGKVASVAGSVVTLRSRTRVDLAGVAVALNGAVSDATRLTAGTNLWVITASGSSSATVALAFDRRDHHSAWHYGRNGFHQHRDESGVTPEADEPAPEPPNPTSVPTQTPSPTASTPDPAGSDQPAPDVAQAPAPDETDPAVDEARTSDPTDSGDPDVTTDPSVAEQPSDPTI